MTVNSMIPLRLFMGGQMIMFGVVCYFSPLEYGFGLTVSDSGLWWVWSIILGGIWLTVIAGLDLYISWHWEGMSTKRLRRAVKVTYVMRPMGYFVCGSIWIGVGYQMFIDRFYQPVDFMAQTYVGFLLFLSYRDACIKREKNKKRLESINALLERGHELSCQKYHYLLKEKERLSPRPR